MKTVKCWGCGKYYQEYELTTIFGRQLCAECAKKTRKVDKEDLDDWEMNRVHFPYSY